MAMSMFGRGAKGAAGMAVKSMQNSSKATGFKASYKMADSYTKNKFVATIIPAAICLSSYSATSVL